MIFYWKMRNLNYCYFDNSILSQIKILYFSRNFYPWNHFYVTRRLLALLLSRFFYNYQHFNWRVSFLTKPKRVLKYVFSQIAIIYDPVVEKFNFLTTNQWYHVSEKNVGDSKNVVVIHLSSSPKIERQIR